jgi:ferrous iron transport protein B
MDLIDAAFSRLGERAGELISNPFPAKSRQGWNYRGGGGRRYFLAPNSDRVLFISVMENSGYLARAAIVMDRFFSKIGLQGKSFLPFISSYACAIPGIMAARTIENRRERLATIFVAPFMTCSARLPVYAFSSAPLSRRFRSSKGFIGLQALALLGLYALGFLAAVLTAGR